MWNNSSKMGGLRSFLLSNFEYSEKPKVAKKSYSCHVATVRFQGLTVLRGFILVA